MRALAFSLALALVLAPRALGECALEITSPPLGTNLGEIVPYDPSLPFCNRIKESGTWSWSAGVTPTFDATTGWPTTWTGTGEMFLYFNRELRRVDEPGGGDTSPAHFPAGSYAVSWSGAATTGDFTFDGSASAFAVTGAGVGNFTVVAPQHQGIRLKLQDPANIPTAFSVVSATTACTGTWRTGFLDDVRHFSVLRFMDWMRTNWSPSGVWANRSTATKYSQTSLVQPNGASVEVMVDLLNAIDRDGWFNLPDTATDEYATQFATYVCANLDAPIRMYLELGNEPWNNPGPGNPFSYAHVRMDNAGIALGLPEPQWFHWQMLRTMEIAALVETVCTDARVTVVLNIQNASDEKSTGTFMNWDPPGLGTLRPRDVIEGLTMAPYFGPGKDAIGGLHSLSSLNSAYAGIANADCTAAGQGPGGAVTCCTGAGTGTCQNTNIRDWIPATWHAAYRLNIAPPIALTAAHCANAASFGLLCLAYEFGVHSTLSGGAAENDTVLVASHWAANDDIGMQDVYLEDLAALDAAGLSLAVHFYHQGRASKFNYFPSCEWYDTCTSSPKYQALKSAATAP